MTGGTLLFYNGLIYEEFGSRDPSFSSRTLKIDLKLISSIRNKDVPKNTTAVITQVQYHCEDSIETKTTDIIQSTICIGVPILKKSTYL